MFSASDRPASPFPPLQSLVAVGRALAAAATAAGVAGPFLVGLRPDGSGPRTHHRVLDLRYLGAAPDRLRGWRAPADWTGAVLVGAGVGTSRAVALAVDHRRSPVLVDDDRHRLVSPSPASDTLLRILGYDTAPPTLTTRHLAAAVWLHRLTEVVLDHPQPWLLSRSELWGRAPIGLGTGVEVAWSTFARSLTDPPFRISETTLGWFDAGSYERALLAMVPELDDLRSDLTDALSEGSAAWLDAQLVRQGVRSDLWAHAGCEPDAVLASFVGRSCDLGAP